VRGLGEGTLAEPKLALLGGDDVAGVAARGALADGRVDTLGSVATLGIRLGQDALGRS